MIMINKLRVLQRYFHHTLVSLMACCLVLACGETKNPSLEKLYRDNPNQLKKLQVTASAYNSLPEQTNTDPSVAAWGDNLKPGMKAIAVSRDLIPLGLNRNTEVKIEGLDGTYMVLDKMNARWSKKIDIYMGLNKDKAKEWGSQQVVIYWKKNK